MDIRFNERKWEKGKLKREIREQIVNIHILCATYMLCYIYTINIYVNVQEIMKDCKWQICVSKMMFDKIYTKSCM